MSIVFHDFQREVLSRIPVYDNEIILCGSDNRTHALSSPNSDGLINLSVQLSNLSLNHLCLTVTNTLSCNQLSMLHCFQFIFPVVQPHLDHVNGPLHLSQPISNALYAINMISSTSHLSEPCRSVQLFIKSIRNATISIHIDSTSSISDLKHLIYVYDGIPPCNLRLMHRGRELRDDALLSGLDVDGGTITCLFRVLGGNPSHQIPVYWWFGFSRSYEDGRAGEGRIRHVLSEIMFGDKIPYNWYTDRHLSRWKGIRLHSVDDVSIFSIQLPRSLMNSLPDSIDNLLTLTILSINNNQLTHLPDSIGNLTSLTDLDVSSNQLTTIPDSIGNLRKLTFLGISNNQLATLPDSIGSLKYLTLLWVHGNPLTSTKDGKQDIWRRFKRVGLDIAI